MEAFFCLLILVALCTVGLADDCYYCTMPSCIPTIAGPPQEQFDPIKDAADLRKAMDRPGTDEATLIKILTSRTENQREIIAEEYVKNGGNLVRDIEKDTSCSFKKMLVALATPLLDFYTVELVEAIKKKDRQIVIEILSTLPACAVQKIAVKYSHYHEKHTLSDDVQWFKWSDFIVGSNREYNKLMLELAKGSRDKDLTVDHKKAHSDAVRLIKDGVGRLGTNEETFIEIFTRRSIPQLAQTIIQYEELRKNDKKHTFKSLEKDIDDEFSGNIQDALIALVINARDQPMYFATELQKVLEKWFKSSEDEEKVIRIIRGRCDIDLQNIKDAYKKQFEKSLYDKLEGKFNKLIKTDYKETLLAVVKK